MIKALSCNFLSIVLKTTTALKSRQLLRTFYKVFSHGTVGTLKMIPTTYPASALTVPITAISIPLREGFADSYAGFVHADSEQGQGGDDDRESDTQVHVPEEEREEGDEGTNQCGESNQKNGANRL